MSRAELRAPSDAVARADPTQVRSATNQYKQIAEILDASADAIISIDDRGMVRRFNRGAEVVFGYRSSEIIGRPLDLLIPERLRMGHRSHMAKFDRATESSRLMNERGEIFGLRKDGAEFPAEASIVRLGGGGRPVFTVIMRDITERKEADAALREREAQLRQAQKMARIGTFVWDESTDSCEYCSDELAALLGMTTDRLIELTAGFNQLIYQVHPDDRENYERVIEQARKTGEPFDLEYQWLRDDGKLIHLREMGEPELDTNDRIIRTFGTVQDITRIRKAEETLRQSEAQLRQAQRLARMGTYVWDEVTGLCVDCSDELAALFGMSPARFVAERGTEKKFAEFVHADDRDRLAATVREGLAGASPYEIEYRVYDAEGDIRHFREIIEPIIDENGRQVRTFGSVQDITHLRHAEQALRQREEQLRAITDNIPAFITYVDKDLHYRFANRLAEEWYGRPSSKIVGRHSEEVMGPEAMALVRPRFEAVLAGERVRFEEIRRFPDGAVRSLDMSYVPDFGDDGQVRGFFALLLDITERRQAENALRRTMRSGDLLRQIATAANAATSAEEAMSVCLGAISKHGGWELAEVFVLADDDSGDMAPAGLWWADNPEDFAAFRQATEGVRFAPGRGLPGRVTETGKPAWIPDVRKDKNFPRAGIAGDIEVTSGFAFPVLVGQKVAAVLEFFSREARERDDDLVDVAVQAGTVLGRVIERQRAERALRDSEEQIRLMTDNVPVLITYIDQKKTFGFVNKTAEEWYGRPASELVGVSLRKVICKVEFAKMNARIERTLTGETVRFEEVFTCPDGVTRHVDATYIPHFGAHGNVRGIFTMVVDVTDRIKTEEQLRHAQRMEAIGKLTGGVAHDFNNLLAVIMGNSEIVRDKLGDADPAVRAITHAALRGSELTQRLLAFSRQKPLRPEAANLADLTKETAGVLSRTLGETIAIKVKSPRKPWPAKVDTGELENAILNLAINARDAMPGGGTLTIETANVTLSAKKAAQFDDAGPGEYIRLSVTDTGEGMPTEVLEHAFEPFYTTKAFGEGSGLGLSMVYGFATQSGGFVTIDSQKGKGATVRIYLPRAKPGDTPSLDCRPLCPPAKQGGVIMVVEDDPDVRRLTVTLLSAMGYTVLEAEDGESALPLILGDRHIDLLLSDVVLTGDMSGPAIAEAALTRRPDLRVMFMSGYAEDVIRRDREGGDKAIDADLLTKPFTRAQLAQKVKAAMGTDES